MWKQMRQKLHSAGLGRLCRRGVTLSLAVSMLLPSVAYGFDALERPIEMVEGEEPTIIIEANAVINRWYDPALGDPSDYLTGEFEVAIRVRSGKIDNEAQLFNTLGVALKYDANILTPCRWTSKWDGTYGDTDREMNLDAVLADEIYEEDCMVSMQTLKNNKISTASAHVCETVRVVETEETAGIRDGYVSIRLDSDRPVELKDDKRDGDMFKDEQGTVLGVISFKYDAEAIKILAKDAEQWLSTNTATGDDGDEGSAAPAARPLIQFATPEELENHYSPVELLYYSETNDMFYSSDETIAPLTGDLTTDDLNRLTLNTETYTEKDVKDHQINFVLTNKTTYNDGGLSLDDLATVLFYDWDDTLIGVLIVPRDGDARKLVNDYVSKTFIHPDLRADKTTGANTNYASLARTNSYRGKYPSSEPKAEGVMDGTEDPNGGVYPLTNKLDYVFVKRPMEQVTEDETGNPVTENLWRQKEAEDGLGAWDDNYPYIHGWAKLPDKDWNNPSAVWTTIGVAELSSFTGLNSGAYENLSDIATGPAELVATAENFKFADFDFRSSNNNTLKAGGVYSVKAVYEPGQELMNAATSYRMISKPYYNKMNYPSAANGAAYSVDITFERASTSTGPVRGISRIRQPDIRQDTTSDIRWEDQYLNNANVDEEIGKGKSGYTNVVVDNADEVEIRLVLSARQNKVDYYLINSFGSSFVTGGARSTTNFEYKDEEHVIDNYNYKTDTSDVSVDNVSADYYDAPYEDRNGSHGFVLYGTLNNMAQKLTEDYNGTLSTLDFNNYISLDNMNDINLRSYNNEKPAARTLPNFLDALRAAVAEAVRLHSNSDDRAWDVEHDYAQFAYHQLQLFVSDYLDPDVTTPTLRTAEDADKVSIKWCHLHESCAAEASGKPRSWNELVATAQRTDKTRNEKIELIRLLSLDEQKAMTHLRADESGTHFEDNRAFAIAWLDAVEAGNTTWDTIQDYIARKQSDASYAQATYWWYDDDKATGIPFGSLVDTIAAVQDMIHPKTVPGETTPVARSAKLNQLKSTFDANAASDAVDTSWNRATKNLAITKDGKEAQKFSSWSDFTDYFSKAVEAAENANVKLEFADDDDADAIAKKTRAYWEKLQYHILSRENDLSKTGIYPASPTTEQQEKMDDYWWYDGAVKVTNLATLILAAQDANSGKPASMDMFKFAALYDEDNKELHFARSFKGEKYDETDTDPNKNEHLSFEEFKEDILAYVQADRVYLRNNDPNWNRVQYYLIHNSIDAMGVSNESGYYWWKEGKDPQPVSFDLGPDDPADPDDPTAPDIREARADKLAQAVMDAAFRSVFNGNTKAWDELTEDVLESGRIVAMETKSEANFPDDFTMYGSGDLNNVKAKLEALMVAVGGNIPSFPTPTATWYQVQYYLLNGSLQNDLWIRNNTNYWWKKISSMGTPPDQLFAELTQKIEAVANAIDTSGDGTAEADDLRGWFTEEISEKLEFTDGGGPVPQYDLDTIPWESFDYSVCGDPFNITWAQIQWMMVAYYNVYFDWVLEDDATARSELVGMDLSADPSTWTPITTYRLRRAPAAAAAKDYSLMINSLSRRIRDLSEKILLDPDMAERYLAELAELREAIAELEALLETAPVESEIPAPTEAVEPDAVEPNDLGELINATEKPDTAEPDTVVADTAEPDTMVADTVEPDTVEPSSVGLDDLGEPTNTDPVKVDTVEPDDPGRLTDASVEPDTVEPSSVGLDDLGEPTNTDPVKVDTVEPDDLGEPTNTAGIGISMASAAENIIEETAVRNVWPGYLVMPSAPGGESRLSAPLTTKLVKRLASEEKQRLITIENRTVYNNSLLISRAGPPLRSPIISRISFDFIDLTNERGMAV